MTLRISLCIAVAGILPVTSVAAQTGWRIDPAPMIDVSASSPAGDVVFSEANGAARFSNGTLLIADPGDLRIRYFSAQGKLLKAVGGKGGGPGEFQAFTWVGRCGGDTLAVWDVRQDRLSLFGANGLIRTVRLNPDTSIGKPQITLACSRSGELAYQGRPAGSVPTGPDMLTISAVIASFRLASGVTELPVTHRIGVFPMSAMRQAISSGGGRGAMPSPIGPLTSIAYAGEWLAIAPRDSTGIIHLIAPDGARKTTTITGPNRAVTPAHLDAATTLLLNLVPRAMRAEARTMMRNIPPPTYLPRYFRVLGDPTGALWVMLSVPGDPSTRWRAITTEGKTLGEVTLPANREVLEFGADYLVAGFDDADDIPHVAVYRLRKN